MNEVIHQSKPGDYNSFIKAAETLVDAVNKVSPPWGLEYRVCETQYQLDAYYTSSSDDSDSITDTLVNRPKYNSESFTPDKWVKALQVVASLRPVNNADSKWISLATDYSKNLNLYAQNLSDKEIKALERAFPTRTHVLGVPLSLKKDDLHYIRGAVSKDYTEVEM
jgi:hypothetical protein